MKNKENLTKEKEKEELKNCSFTPIFFTKAYRSSSNSRISTVMKQSQCFSPFSSHRSIISNKTQRNKECEKTQMESNYEKLKIKGNRYSSKWYYHDSYQKEFERKREFSNKKLVN